MKTVAVSSYASYFFCASALGIAKVYLVGNRVMVCVQQLFLGLSPPSCGVLSTLRNVILRIKRNNNITQINLACLDSHCPPTARLAVSAILCIF